MMKKKRKMMKWFNRVVTSVLFVLLIGVASMVLIAKVSGGEPNMFGYQLKTVLSGSMEPDIKTGSIIAVKPGGDMTRFEQGDVITFQEDANKLVTHRVIDVSQSGENTMYQTKGDNNSSPDAQPVLSENVVAQYTGFTIPYVGYFISFAQSKNGAFLLLIPGFLLIGYSVFTIWRALSTMEISSKEKNESEKDLSSESHS